MQAPLGAFTDADVSSRRNWVVCWRWAVWVLIAELILILAFAGFAMSRLPVSQVTSQPMQTERAQPQWSGSGHGACRLVAPLKTQDL